MKSRLLGSPSSPKSTNLRIDRIENTKTPLDSGSLVAVNDYILFDEAEYFEVKRIASTFLRVQDDDTDLMLN